MMTVVGSISLLKNVPLFSALGDVELAAMLQTMQQRTYAPRTCILRAGEIGEGLYVVLSGRVRVLLDDGEGHEIIVAVYGANEFFGEIELMDGGPRLANYDCTHPTEVLHIPRKVVLEWLERDPALAMLLLRTVTRRLADAHQKIGNLALVNVYGRVARVLLEEGHEANGEWHVEPGAEQIAAMVGASREMVSRVVKDMINRGIVRRYKRKLIVMDRQLLLEGHCRPAQRKDAVTASSISSSQPLC
ncbi:MAG TPA: Crp/Fnr family transcriptional regulator [Burkholderiales bacterium]|nr:Crp/Fnr family transcriptional regulator [Burkholderiales bacterium]